jgi:hypothetical protein
MPTDTEPTNWLVYVHVPNSGDLKKAIKSLQVMQASLAVGVGAWVMLFGPTVKSTAFLYYFTRDSHRNYVQIPMPKGIDSVETTLSTFVKFIKTKQSNITAAFFWCHGSGWALSPYKGWKRPFLPTEIAVRLILRPFRCQFVVFDACFQGSMSSLYELDSYVQVVLAAPAFHPFKSILETNAFGQLRKGVSKSQLLQYADQICCEWNTLTKVKYKCLLVFDMAYIDSIAKLVKEHWHLLSFGKHTQIDREDSNLHDLFLATGDQPQLHQLRHIIQQSIHASCNLCKASCTSKVNGVSVEARLPRKWIPSYTNTKWFKHIVGGQKRFVLD